LALGRLLEPSEGHIELDRVNTSTLSLEALRSAITVVPQEPVLFSGPLRDSLDPFRTSSDAEITEALGRVELDRFVAELPGGLSATVNEGGSNFSCGQRQLFCLARALLRRCKVIVLDEATANIDVETDSAIQRTIRREFVGATVLVVAHRLGTVIDSDLMLVLEHGRVAEFGAPAQLLPSPNSALAGFLRELQRGAA
jgi:ABC-type multidrug transport system fused ATPase/permease subunit